MNKEQILDEYFMEARSNLLDIAAFIDRMDRAPGKSDHRATSLSACLAILNDLMGDKTRRILECLSDPTVEPVEKAFEKGATGAWPGFTGVSP